MLKISSTFYSRPFEEHAVLLQFIGKLRIILYSSIILRVEHSNCISRIFWFGSGSPEFKKMRSNIFLKEAKDAALQLRSPAG
jgi:hypothetical protein